MLIQLCRGPGAISASMYSSEATGSSLRTSPINEAWSISCESGSRTSPNTWAARLWQLLAAVPRSSWTYVCGNQSLVSFCFFFWLSSPRSVDTPILLFPFHHAVNRWHCKEQWFVSCGCLCVSTFQEKCENSENKENSETKHSDETVGIVRGKLPTRKWNFWGKLYNSKN